MPQHTITVLVSLYKAGKFIRAKINNLIQQTIIHDCQVVFLNCQNLDNEREAYVELLGDENFREIMYDSHRRLYPTWNDGIQCTQSKYVVNSNVDDMWHPKYLQYCTQYLDKHPEAACVSSGVLVTEIPNQDDPAQWRKYGKYPLATYPQSTAGPCPVWRRSLHDKYGWFGDYSVIGDARMWEKWNAGGEQFHLIKDFLVLYYASSNSLERRHDPDTGVLLRDLDLRHEKEKEINNGNNESQSSAISDGIETTATNKSQTIEEEKRADTGNTANPATDPKVH